MPRTVSRPFFYTNLALLVGLSPVSVAFWAWLRFRTAPAAEIEEGPR